MSEEDPPEWFVQALACSPVQSEVTVEGCRIAYQSWGLPASRGVVLVHGGAAHKSWWDHVGPHLTDNHGVLALDLSGHGDSGQRDMYPVELWADEIAAVGAAGGFDEPPILVAHSLGGWPAITAAARHPDEVGGVIMVDSSIRDVTAEDWAAQRNLAFGPLRTYATYEEARARFRTVPRQASYLPYVVDHVAANSLRQVEGGWQWKYDPKALGFRQIIEELRRVKCGVALLRAENGSITPDIAEFMYEHLGQETSVIDVPLAGHHIMLDQPLMLIMAIRTLLGLWDHKAPRPRVSAAGG